VTTSGKNASDWPVTSEQNMRF